MSAITVMDNDEKSELSCMTYLLESGLVATGHEDGHIKLWNLEIGTCVLITGDSDNKMRHKNTVSCIKAIKYKNSEYLICGSFDGTVSLWEISMK
jgi:WD40 repeat protein